MSHGFVTRQLRMRVEFGSPTRSRMVYLGILPRWGKERIETSKLDSFWGIWKLGMKRNSCGHKEGR